MGKLGTKVQVGWQCDPKIWEANLAAWRARDGGKDLLPLWPDQPPRLKGLTRAAGPYPSLQTPGEHGRLVSLHSAQDPWREAESLAKRVTLEAFGACHLLQKCYSWEAAEARFVDLRK